MLDITAGPFIYLGPSYTERREFTISQTFNPSNQLAVRLVGGLLDCPFQGEDEAAMTASLTNAFPARTAPASTTAATFWQSGAPRN